MNTAGAVCTLYLSWGPDVQEKRKTVDNRFGALSLRIGVICDNEKWDRPR